MVHSDTLVVFLGVIIGIAFGYKRETPDTYVSPPFARVAEQAYDLDSIKSILNDVDNYNPNWGKFGISMSILYYVRNARLAIQYYHEPASYSINNEPHQDIWTKLFELEMDVFRRFRAWHDARDNKDEVWREFVRVVHNIFDDHLRYYLPHFLKDDFIIKMPIYASNGIGVKYNIRKNRNDIPSNMEFDRNNPFIPTIKFNDKANSFPLIGFGSWPMTGDQCKNAVAMALKNGYRMIDTSENYHNAEKIAEAMAESGIDRSEILIATKLSVNDNYGRGVTTKAFEKSLERLGVDYIDVYMTHGAIADKRRLREAWEELEVLYNAGKIKYLGVSNYSPRDMNELLSYAKVKPMFVQNKYDVFTIGQQAPWTEPIGEWVEQQVSNNYNVIVQGYCVLNSWPHSINAVNDKHIEWIAYKYGKTSAQLLIRWALQSNIGVLTRSSKDERQINNLNVFDFEINDNDMQLLNGLNTLYNPFDTRNVYDVYGQVSNRPNLNRQEL
eukprot:551519_1